MPKKTSAGVLLYRIPRGDLQVFLVHPGGPYWKNKDDGAWSIPKGEFQEGDDPLTTAKREFFEETGHAIQGEFHSLTPFKQPGGKLIHAWAVEGDFEPAAIRSNTFSIEWPPRSGIVQEFPEVDRGEWFSVADAQKKLLPGQRAMLDELRMLLREREASSGPR